jgi:hypothetical protein
MMNGNVAGYGLNPVSAIESYARMTKVKSSRSAPVRNPKPLAMPRYLTDTHWKLRTYDKAGRVQTWIYSRETGDLIHEVRPGKSYHLGSSDSVAPGAYIDAVC